MGELRLVTAADAALGYGQVAGGVAEAQAAYVCTVCRDMGWVSGNGGVRRCECREAAVAAQRFTRAGVPLRYAEASFATFRTDQADPTILSAVRWGQGLMDVLMVDSMDRGLLLCGPCGVGKTHLAVALLREAIKRYGMSARFWDMNHLLLELKRGYAEAGEGHAESAVAREFAEVEVLVVDELGGERLTDWSFGEVQLLLNQRYNAGGRRPRLTVFTTNYPARDVGEGARGERTLGDQVGARTFSRLMEMCKVFEMVGQDWRKAGR